MIGALLRGRVGLPSVAQAALAFALRAPGAAPHRTRCAVEHDRRRSSTGMAVVRLAGPHGPLDVTVRVERVAARRADLRQPAARTRYFAYRPVSVVAVDHDVATRDGLTSDRQ